MHNNESLINFENSDFQKNAYLYPNYQKYNLQKHLRFNSCSSDLILKNKTKSEPQNNKDKVFKIKTFQYFGSSNQ